MKTVGFKHSKLALLAIGLAFSIQNSYADPGNIDISTTRTYTNTAVSPGGYLWIRAGVELTMDNSTFNLHGNNKEYPYPNDVVENKGNIYFKGSGAGIRWVSPTPNRNSVYTRNYSYMEFTEGASFQQVMYTMYANNYADGVMLFDNGKLNMTQGYFTNEGQMTFQNNSSASVTTYFVNKGTITLDSDSTFTTSKFNSDNGSVILNGGELDISNTSVIQNLTFGGGTLVNGDGQTITASSGSGTLNQTTYTADTLFTVESGSNAGTINANAGLVVTGEVVNTGDWKVTESLKIEDTGEFSHDNGTLEIVGEDLLFTDSVSWKPNLNTIGITANTPQEVNSLSTDYFIQFLPGEVRESLKGHLVISEDGIVKVTGVTLTETERDALVSAFKETFFIRFPKAFPQLSALWLWA